MSSPATSPPESTHSKARSGSKKKRPWRYYNILLHRYLGYLFLGTTVVYAISGLAVNHMEDWNPNYSQQRQTQTLAPLADPENLSPAEGAALYAAFGLSQPFNPDNVFYPDEHLIDILIASDEKIRINTQSWQAEHERTVRRPVLHLFNFLHLNNAKKAWTFYADLYAIALLLMALSGLLMKSGRKGVWGEAGLWTLVGMVVPLGLILLYYR